MEKNERDMLIERLKEIEEELYTLKEQDALREQDYQARLKDMEIRKVEAELEKEAEALKKAYPSFDVEAELENPQFAALLNAGLPMKTAYEAIHLEEIKNKSEKEEKKENEKDKDKEKKAERPSENGISTKGGLVLKSGVHSLSKRDRAELAKRAGRGETIRF